ncbi:DUF1064 domain-containing protein [Candidatus Sumerlaeota bacterium]|nr:DUF1064 domain-containing protein [Candidatus Sumerlaeota bacterium]
MSETMSAKEYQGWLAGKFTQRKNKFNAQRTEYNGVMYDSKGEAQRAAELDQLKRAGLIRFWIRQPPFYLGSSVNLYRADFLVIGPGAAVWAEDFKGKETPGFRRNRRLWREYGPCELRVIKKGKVTEVIKPKET